MSVLCKRSSQEANLDSKEAAKEPPKKKAKHNKNASYYELFGNDSCVEISIKRGRDSSSLHSKDFHTLMLWMLGETVCPSWIFIKHRPLIEKVIIIQIDDLNENLISLLLKQHVKFPFFNQKHYCPLQLDIPKFDKSIRSKYPSFKKLTVVQVDKIKTLKLSNTNCNSNNNNKNKKKKRNNFNVPSQFGTKYKHVPEKFIITEHELESNGFPSYHDPQNRYQHFFCLPPTKPTKPAKAPNIVVSCIEKLVGLDCEMVVTTKGLQLARISIVSGHGECKCIYDELVKPMDKIIDYCTKYSGITKLMLQNVSTRLSDIHAQISQFMDENTIICGHGLENDLLALQMVHYKCIDTALLYPASSSHFKNKLSYLSNKFLKRNIQQSRNGHNSHEDALAALDLVKLKLQHGPEYGLPKAKNYVSIFTVLHHFGRKSSLIGPSELFVPISSSTPVSSIPTISNNESVKKSLSIIKNVENENSLIWMYLNRMNEVELLYNNLMDIYLSSVENTVLIVMSGNKDFSRLNEFSFMLAKAIRDGQIKEAEALATQIRNENINAKQYPFWIFAKNSSSK